MSATATSGTHMDTGADIKPMETIRLGMRYSPELREGLGVTRLLSTQLFGVEPTDPATFTLVAVGLALVALVATLVPAMRATRVDPLVALRQE